MRNRLLIFLGSVYLVACTSSNVSGPVNVRVIRPIAGQKCAYTIAPATIQTLTSLQRMTGALGAVVHSGENLGSRPEILDHQAGLNSVDVDFTFSNGAYAPLGMDSLFAASLYYAIETAHLTFASLDPSGDMPSRVYDFANRTRIVHDAKRTHGDVGKKKEVVDNAEYLSHEVGTGSQKVVLNYLFSYPTETVEDIPLGLNLGIMAHEYTHLVMHHLFYEPGFARDIQVTTGTSAKPTAKTLSALDEGNADYFGFLASRDPSFFQCSFPEENRDLLVPKSFTAEIASSIATGAGYDSHEGGAVWAAINYEIGTAIGYEENGRLLLRLMSYLLDCPDAQSGSNTLNLDFKAAASCHAKLAGSQHQATIRQIYNNRLGAYGGI